MKQTYSVINIEALKSRLSPKKFRSNSIKSCDGDPVTLSLLAPLGSVLQL